jgi:Putative auto-transporter adhesin, head GIN domain
MKSTWSIPVVLSASFALMACGASGSPSVSLPVTQGTDTAAGSGTVGTQARTVNGFSKVNLAGIGELSITQGATESLSIEAEENLLPLLETLVEDGTLEIRVKANTSLKTTKPIKYTLTVKSLNQIGMTGAANITLGALNTPNLEVKLNGAGSIRISSVQTQSFKADMLGVGVLNVTGTTASQAIVLDGTTKYNACGLQSDTASVSVAGTSNAVVSVKNSLMVTGAGIGAVDYVGNPKLEQSNAGLSKVTKLAACPSE